MMWPVDPWLEGSPSETLLPSREAMARAMSTPTVVAIATPTMKGVEIFSGLGAVTKMIADMICGPAIIVMARGEYLQVHDLLSIYSRYEVPRATASCLVDDRVHPALSFRVS